MVYSILVESTKIYGLLMPSREDGWLPAKVRAGPPVPCPAGDGDVLEGQWQKGQRIGGLYRVWHDDCSEEEGAYDNYYQSPC